jgi:hypothetical protein
VSDDIDRIDVLWGSGDHGAKSSQPLLHQHGHEVQPFDRLRRFPIGLASETRNVSCQLLAESCDVHSRSSPRTSRWPELRVRRSVDATREETRVFDGFEVRAGRAGLVSPEQGRSGLVKGDRGSMTILSDISQAWPQAIVDIGPIEISAGYCGVVGLIPYDGHVVLDVIPTPPGRRGDPHMTMFPNPEPHPTGVEPVE